ncbi:ArsR/SmtB family transcription factor [Stackebrandtia nassauensis]|uniref:Transcriptional regulator, ArsR family n=1 Tax=Stackebrandtia nassauensis (strain DSM 44728 / CIP 108903 / NRRL B-16338 / NBRC 102104 / LLR-40K-21) TaxID=446470 RepID=D3PUY8_STANL|nr:metalloregulator ArsR/SmtB family transcription factor [Stackebrandtia nassauensis]ADD45012.1 transcriptional regulator, ArsR family [Stackebrandtia nassauensis DSM 44728]
MTTAATSLSSEAQAFLKALASPTRQQIMFAFDGGGELTVGDVAERLELAQSATSTHLAMLRDAGILVARRDWKTVYYRANPAGFLKSLDDLRDYLMACCPPDCAASSQQAGDEAAQS